MTLVTRKIGLDEYFVMLEKYSPHWLYHSKPWIHALMDGFGVNIYALATNEPDHGVVALTPVIKMRKGIFDIVGSPMRGMYTEFMGPLFSDDIDDHMKQEIIVSQHIFLKSCGGSYISWGIKCDENTRYLAGLEKYGYVRQPRKSLVVNLQGGADHVWKSFAGRARNMVRKAEKNGVVVRAIKPEKSDVERYYRMLAETFNRQGLRPPHPISFFYAICRYLMPKAMIQFYTAEKQGRLISGAIFLVYQDRMMYLSGTSNEEGLKSAASSLIQWEAMKDAMQSGIEEYDLGGVGKERIDKFKESFGGQPVEHHLLVYKTLPVKFLESIFSYLAEKGWAGLHR